MIDLTNHYNQLWLESVKKIKNDNFQVDELIDSEIDNRFGITLLIRPPEEVKTKINQVLNQLRMIEPGQYYYPETDLHITVMSIISCYSGFSTEQINMEDYIQVIKNSLAGCRSFDINLKGFTLSPACIMVQGFLFDSTLKYIRENLRLNFKNTNLQQTIDKRYAIQAAHVTSVRFRQKVTSKAAYLNKINKYRDYSFGKFTVCQMELVYNDWYQRNDRIKTLFRFNLSRN